jgi:hypothetical protein
MRDDNGAVPDLLQRVRWVIGWPSGKDRFFHGGTSLGGFPLRGKSFFDLRKEKDRGTCPGHEMSARD